MPGAFSDSVMNPHYAEMLSALSAAKVEYLIVALAAHGNPRATGNIDIWVRPTRENAVRVMKALREFGAPLFDLTLDDPVDTATVFQIGIAPVRIDILTGIDGVQFDDAWSRSLEVDLGSARVAVLGLEDLATNKRAGRSGLDRSAPSRPFRRVTGTLAV
jgi:hypothetical protein